MPSVPQSSSPEFLDFVFRLTSSAAIEQLSSASGLPPLRVRTHVDLAVGEAGQTLRVLAGLELASGARLLEVGAGLGLTSAFLSACGFDVTALEPGGQGFEDHAILAAHLVDLVSSRHHTLTVPAQGLDAAVHGTFDLVFSNNVLEHVEQLHEVLDKLAAMVTDDGVSVHSCPNYSVPYEPHYGIPLLPVRPRWTARVLPKSVRTDGVWQSLNFVRARDVVGIASSQGAQVKFRPAALANSLERLGSDSGFRQRHRLLGGVAAMARRLRLIPLLRRLPATWSTPMDFLICQRDIEPSRLASWLHPAAE